ncbi:MAG: Maf family protein [Actinobacteria bacterium]|nr:Maf family protein [Actinomycetota bacterium]
MQPLLPAEKIEGCYTNVVGLPLVKLIKMLREFGVKDLGFEKNKRSSDYKRTTT